MTMKMRLHNEPVHLLSSTLVITILFLDVLHGNAVYDFKMFMKSVELPGFQLGACAIQGKRLPCCIWGIQKRAV
jgi:hypothetical protein